MSYPSFSDFLRGRVGANWVLARRSAGVVRRYGDDVVCLSDKQYRGLQDEWLAAHPATLMVAGLPADDAGQLIRKATEYQLRSFA